jgi:hypothetical protein
MRAPNVQKAVQIDGFSWGLFAFKRAHLRTQRIYQRDFRVKWKNSTIFSCIKTTLLNYFGCICATFKKVVDSACHCATFELLVDCSLFASPPNQQGDTFQTTERCSG